MDEQLQPQPDVGDSDMAAGTETPDAETTQRTRIVTKRSDPAVPTEGVLKKMRIWSKHSCPLTPAVVSEQQEKRAIVPETPASVNPETFTMMFESDDNLETYTELNAVALDLHEPDPETMWSSDLGWVDAAAADVLQVFFKKKTSGGELMGADGPVMPFEEYFGSDATATSRR